MLFQRFTRGYPSRRIEFFKTVGDGAKILEIGCGDCGNLQAAEHFLPNCKKFGVDIEASPNLPDSIQFSNIDITKDRLPFDNKTFDAILMIHVIEHLDNYQHATSEISRVLKPGGHFFVETPNWISMLVPSFGLCREQSFAANFFDDPTHVRPWTKQSLFEVFNNKNLSLRVSAVKTTINWKFFWISPVVLIYSFLKKDRIGFLAAIHNLIGWNIYVEGTKY